MRVQHHDRAHEEDQPERADELGDVGGRPALGRVGDLSQRTPAHAVVDAGLLDPVAGRRGARLFLVPFQILVGHSTLP
jgi:hypothetical protein